MKNYKTIQIGLFLLMTLATHIGVMAQESPERSDSIIAPKQEEQIIGEAPGSGPEIFIVVEDMPEFPGGQDSMAKFISDNLIYPALAQENNIQGRVVVQFIVEEDGRISNVKLVSTPLGWGLDEAAIRVIKKMPNWKPGKQRGEPVKVRFVIPIRFQLSDGAPEKKPKEGK
jgi:protein TonB